MRPDIKVLGVKELQKHLDEYKRDTVSRVKKETYASGIDIQREAKTNLRAYGAWDTGNAANSIMVDVIEGGFIAEIGPTAPYPVYIETGARPHFPPPDALEGWARRHGFDSAWPICLAIAKRGLPERPFLRPAYDSVKPKFLERIKEIFRKGRK